MGKCAMDLVTCAKEHCNVEVDDFEPFIVAIETAHIGETDNGIIEVIKECQDASRQCIADAHGPIEKAKCFVQFGVCLATKLSGLIGGLRSYGRCQRSCKPASKGSYTRSTAACKTSVRTSSVCNIEDSPRYLDPPSCCPILCPQRLL